MDEFFEAIVLIQTLKQANFPVILMVREYWNGLITWTHDVMHKEHQYINHEDLKVFTMADEPAEAVKIITDFRQQHGPGGIALPPGMKKKEEPTQRPTHKPPL